MNRDTEDLETLESFLERSDALWVAMLTPAGEIFTANSGLRASAEDTLNGRPFVELIVLQQHAAFEHLLERATSSDWVSATLATQSTPLRTVVDRVVHLRRNAAGLLLIAEPADRQREQHLTQMLGVNDSLVAAQRELAERQLELRQAHAIAEQAVRRLETLERITVSAMEDDDPRAGMRMLLDQARELVGGQRSYLKLLDADGRHLTLAHHLGLHADHPIGSKSPLGDGIAGLSASTGRAIIVDDVVTDPRVSGRARRATGSLIAVPLRVHDAVVGVLLVGADRTGAFADNHVALLAEIGDRAAAVLAHVQNARQEHRIAEAFQRSMLPAALPTGVLELVAHYRPQADGSAVGGDWYDAVTFPDGQVALSIGDVAGKGLRAAVTMGQLRSAMSALALSHREPADLLERLDLFASRLGTMVTALYLLVDSAAGTVTYSRAGHLPPLLRDAAGRVELLDGALSPPLGFGAHERSQATTQLSAGSQLVLYTDGLIERRGENLAAAIESLRTACAEADVAPSALGAHLLDQFSDSPTGFGDDVAILTAFLPVRPRSTPASDPATIAGAPDRLVSGEPSVALVD